jgi:prepilin-type N-terminal cleavage/methylation domain-containing protein
MAVVQRGHQLLEATVIVSKTTITIAKQNRMPERGFTLLEVLISMVVLTIGLCGLLAAITYAMAATQTSQEDLTAKGLANEAMESIFTARDTSQAQWSDIQNVNAGGIFLDPTATQQIYTAGTDGIVGTADDYTTGTPETMILPGKDGILGTSDDKTVGMSNFSRTGAINPVKDNNGNIVSDLRTITITITYTVPRLRTPKTYVLTGYISQYR